RNPLFSVILKLLEAGPRIMFLPALPYAQPIGAENSSMLNHRFTFGSLTRISSPLKFARTVLLVPRAMSQVEPVTRGVNGAPELKLMVPLSCQSPKMRLIVSSLFRSHLLRPKGS